MAYTKYSLTPANNTSAPPDGAPEGMLPSAVNDTMRDMMAQIRDVGDGVRDGTYTMTAPKITGGTITGVTLTGNTLTNPVITGATLTTGALNGTVGATTASTGAFTTINASTSITNAALTSGRVTLAGASGLLADSANLTFDGTMLSAPVARIGTFASFGTEVLQAAKNNGAGSVGSAYQFAINSKNPNSRAEMIMTDGSQANAFISYAPSATAASDIMSFNLQGINVLTLAGSGIVTMAGYGAGAATFSAAGVISSVSDENWKTKDGVPTNPDAMLKKLEPGYWFYNEEKKETFGTDRQLGFYAQNVHEAIGEEAAPTPETYVTTDINGAETTVTKPWGYYDRSVLAVVVMSLKNALSTIEQQQTAIDDLTARLNKAGL